MNLVLLALGCGVRSVLKTGEEVECMRSADIILDRYLDMLNRGRGLLAYNMHTKKGYDLVYMKKTGRWYRFSYKRVVHWENDPMSINLHITRLHVVSVCLTCLGDKVCDESNRA